MENNSNFRQNMMEELRFPGLVLQSVQPEVADWRREPAEAKTPGAIGTMRSLAALEPDPRETLRINSASVGNASLRSPNLRALCA